MEVKNKFNYPIGRIDESGSSRNATHYQAGVVGFYNESSDLTYDCRNRRYVPVNRRSCRKEILWQSLLMFNTE